MRAQDTEPDLAYDRIRVHLPRRPELSFVDAPEPAHHLARDVPWDFVIILEGVQERHEWGVGVRQRLRDEIDEQALENLREVRWRDGAQFIWMDG